MPVAQVLTAYIQHIRTVKSAQTDIYYLREVFGPVLVVPARKSPVARGPRH